MVGSKSWKAADSNTRTETCECSVNSGGSVPILKTIIAPTPNPHLQRPYRMAHPTALITASRSPSHESLSRQESRRDDELGFDGSPRELPSCNMYRLKLMNDIMIFSCNTDHHLNIFKYT